MLMRRTADEPERVLQPFGERREALSALDHARVFPLRMSEREVIEPMREDKARHRHAQLSGIGEVRQTLRAGRMILAVNGPRNLPSLGPAIFPTLAGLVISRLSDR